ncbi:O-antigen polymerase [uncultured Draconibacterium sp.]|uniref:O-antigen polymerase n=1 Tax=uncultured Draconibacterium sp. TaxID=1573823 RepID=UPI003261C8CC
MGIWIVIGVLFILLRKIYSLRGSFFTPSVMVVSLYFFSVVASIFEISLNQEQYKNYSFYGTEYFISSISFLGLLLIFLWPLVSFREDRIEKITIPKGFIFHSFSITLLLLSLFSLIYFIPIAFIALTLDNIGEVRQSIGTGHFQLVNDNIFNTVAGTTASFYQIPMAIALINFARGKHNFFSYALLLSSTSYIFFIFSAVGRDGIVFWLFSFLGLWSLFRTFIPTKINHNFKRILILISIVGLSALLLITFSRFRDAPFKSILSYFGQSFPNFCIAYNIDLPVATGKAFPLFRSIIGLPETVNDSDLINKLNQEGTVSYIFGTFLKTFVFSFGKFGTWMIGIIISILFVPYFKSRAKILSFSKLLVYLLFFQILSQGVFYFRQYNRVGNLLIIVYIILAVLFYLLSRISGSIKISIPKK